MTDLGGVELLPMGEGDQDEGNLEEIFGNWSRLLVESLTNEPNEVISSKIMESLKMFLTITAVKIQRKTKRMILKMLPWLI